MDWKPRIREMLGVSQHVLDEDIVEELAAHAGNVYEGRRADGFDVSDAEAHVLSVIESWRTEAPQLRRYGVLLKPMPWPEPERLIRLTETRQGASLPHPLQITNGVYLAWQAQPVTIEALGGFWTSTVTMTGAGDSSRTTIGHVTASIFDVIRARPQVGVLFSSQEEADSEAVILSDGMWQERFGGNPGALGQRIQLDGIPHTIVGVMPREFEFPDSGTRAWIPYHVRPVMSGDGRGTNSQIFAAIARLRPGATPAQAAAEATARGRSAPRGGLADMAFWGTSNPGEISAAPVLDALTADVRPGIVVMFALPSFMPSDFPRLQGVSLDTPVAAFALGLTFITGVVVGVLPAILAGRVNLVEWLAAEGKGSIGGKRSGTSARLLIIALDSIMTMEDRLSASLEKPRFYALLLITFSVSALLIAGVGLFGVLSYGVSQRTREFALRTALGAKPVDIIRLVLKQGFLIAVSGIGAGTWLSFAFTKYLAWLLYGVGSRDWVSIAGVCFVILGIALIACIVPAVRAIRIAPVRALHA